MLSNTNGHGDLQALVERLNRRCEVLRGELAEAEQQAMAVQTTLGLLGTNNIMRYPRIDVSGMTQTEALVALAKASTNGHILAKQARQAMIASGILKDNKNSTSAVFAALRRCKQLRKVAPGDYVLVKQKPEPNDILDESPLLATGSGASGAH